MKRNAYGYRLIGLLPLVLLGAAHCSSGGDDRGGEHAPSLANRTLQSDSTLRKADVPEGPVDPMFLAALDSAAPPNAGGPHPRLAFSAGDLPALRARVREAGSIPNIGFEAARRGIDAYVVPDVHNAIEGQGKFGREHMALSGLLWLLTEDTRYLDKAKAILASQMKAAPAYGATLLFDAQDYYTQRSFILTGLSLAYDWLYSALSIDERKQLHDAIMSLGTELYIDAHTAWWATVTTASNFTGNNGTAFGTAGLAVWDEEPVSAPLWVARATQLLRSYGGGGFDAAGASYEGALYGNYGLRNPAFFAHALERAGGPNPLREGHLAHHEEWFAYEMLPGGGALNPMNDARYEELEEAYIGWASSHGANPPLAQWIARQWRLPENGPPNVDDVSISEMLFYKPPPSGFSPEQQLPLAKFFPGRGLVHVRNGFTKKTDFVAAFEARQTNFGQGVHQQADVGNFVLYAEGARFAVDTGYCNYVDALLAGNTNAVRSCETKGHNAVEADGRSQDFLGHGAMRTFATTSAVGAPGALDVAVSDARNGYLLLPPARADRLFLHVRAADSYPEYLVVSDAFRQDGLLQHDYASYLHTDNANQVATSGGGASVEARITASNGASLRGTWVGSGLAIGVDSFVADYPGVGTHPRIAVSSKSVEYDAVGVLIPSPAGVTAPSVQPAAATGGVAATVGLDATTRDLALERTSGDAVAAQGVRATGAFAWLRLRTSGAPERYALVEGTRLDWNGTALAQITGKQGTVVVGAGAVAVTGRDVTGFRAYVGPTAPTRVTLDGQAVNVRQCTNTVVYPANANCP